MKNFLLLLCVSIALFSCKESNDLDTEDNINTFFKFRKHVSQATDYYISTTEHIVIRLNEPVQAWSVDQDLDDDLIQLSPRVKGTIKVVDAQTVKFVPDEPLEQDAKYVVKFKLGSVIDVPDDLSMFEFLVKTVQQNLIVNVDPVHSYDSDYKYITGSVETSDIVSKQDVIKVVKARLLGKEVPVEFNATIDLGKYFEFKIDSIKRPLDDVSLELTWDGSSIGADQKGSNPINIPGKNSFVVTDVELMNDNGQYLLINFSDPIKKSQDMKGLVAVEGLDNYRYDVSGNELKIFIDKPLAGSKKIEVFKAIKSSEGYNLKHEYTNNIAFEQMDPNVALVQNGVILPSSQHSKINFKAVNLNAVDVWVYKVYANNILQFLQHNNITSNRNLRQVGRPVAHQVLDLASRGKNINKWNIYSLNLNDIVSPDPGALYRVEFKFKKAYSAYECDNSSTDEPEAENQDDYDTSYQATNWDSYQEYYEDYDYDYNWQNRDDPCSPSYYRNKGVSTNILASDIGVTVKEGSNNSYLIAVNNIVTTQALGGAQVALYNYQQQKIYEGRTDADGLLFIDLRDESAYFAQVTYNNQYGYVRLDDGNALSISKYDTSGKKLQNGIKGYIYGERGVWRPGDHMYLTFVLNDANNKLPIGHPIKLELRDPNGKITHREVSKSGLNNFYQFDIQTDDQSPTGNWNASIKVGGITFNKTIKVETIKPNRLKINLAFNNDIISTGTSNTGQLQTMWLHGATARGLKAEITAKLYPTTTSFKGYDSYVFDDPSRFYDSEEIEIFKDQVDQQGQATFSFNPGENNQSPGMLKASFLSKVYENGGDFSTNVTTKTLSPYDTYVGLDVPPGDKQRGMLVTDHDHTFDVITLDQQGQPKASQNLEVTIYKVKWRWWWQSSSNSLSRYESRESKEQIMSTRISTKSNGKASFKFNLPYPEWGRYLVRVYDPKSGHATGKIIYIDWPGWAGKSRKTDPETASMLIFNADRDTYQVGDNATVTFPSASGGRALVTIENGTEVLDAQWVNTQDQQTKVNIPLNNLYVPNIYVHISYLQPHSQTANDLPLRMYGVIPIKVENNQTHLQPIITMPDQLTPESQATITIKEKNQQPMTYTIAVVDEGLLDLTNFKTPNPWDTFFAREALGVKTWDLFDDVIGAYGGRIDAAFAIGGDANAQNAKAKKANRFNPMVIHLGPFQLPAGSTKTHTLNIPRYIGSVRTMVVAGNQDNNSYGSAHKTTAVKKPLMILASLPRKLSQGETVKLPITVFAMQDDIKNVSITLQDDPHFELLNGATQQLKFTETGDQIAYFDIKVLSTTGIADIALKASSNSHKASYSTQIDVINPNPFTTLSSQTQIDPGSTQQVPITPFGTNGSNSAQVTFSSLPSMDINRRLNYLIRYPHGCLEQTTSAAFPQLYINKVVDLTTENQSKTTRNVKAAIKKLKRYQRPNGGFSYWPGANQINDWSTSYAGHFLIEAEKAGYTIPIAFKSNWIAYQKRTAKQWRWEPGNDLQQAYRLYTLALAGAPDLSSMNRLKESPNLSNNCKLRLAAAYALVGQQKAAKQLLSQANIDFKPSKYDYRNYGSPLRNRAMALETMILLKDNMKSRALLEDIAKSLDGAKYLNTQETAYSLLSTAKYIDYIGGKGVDITYTYDSKSSTVNTNKSIASRNIDINTQPTSVSITNNGSNSIFINTAITGKLPVGKEKSKQGKLKTQVTYTDKSGKSIDLNNITQGTQINAKVIVTNTTGIDINDVALTQIIPSGWEIINTRFTDYGSNTYNKSDYTDIRDDRVNYYFDLDPNESLTFNTVINASYLGKYYLPGVQAEAMYDHEYIARNKGQWVEIIK